MGYFYPNGLSTHADAHRFLTGAIYTSAPVYFVDSVNGNDSWLGTNKLRPLATLAAADNASEYRVIVLLNGHSETYTAAATIETACVVSEVVNGASLGLNAAAAAQFGAPTGTGLDFVGILFAEQTQANATSRFTFSKDGYRLLDCTIEADGADDNTVMIVSGNGSVIVGCTFKCVGTSATDLPAYSLLAHTGPTKSSEVRECVFDAGTTSLDSEYELYIPEGSNTLRKAYGNTFRFGAQGGLDCDCVGYTGVTHGGGGFVFDVGMEVMASSSTSEEMLSAPMLFCTDPILWVDSASGSDTNDGEEETPFATLAAAIASISAGTYNRIIILKSTHDETVTTSVSFSNAGLVVVGETGAQLTLGADTNLLNVNAAVEIRNVVLDSSVTLGAASFLATVTADFVSFVGCTFNCAANVTAAAVNLNSADHVHFRDCLFISTSTTTKPNQAMRFNDCNGLTMDGCTFDGGTTGFDTWALQNTAAATPVKITDLTLKSGADVSIHSNSGGFVQVALAENGCNVEAF